MSYFVGRRGGLGIAKCDTALRGSAVAPTFWLPYNSISFDEKTVSVDQESAFGRIEDADASYVTKKYAEGEFEYDLEDKVTGLILAAVAGAVPSSSAGRNG